MTTRVWRVKSTNCSTSRAWSVRSRAKAEKPTSVKTLAIVRASSRTSSYAARYRPSAVAPKSLLTTG